MIIITGICLMPPKYKVVNLAGKILCYTTNRTYKSVRKQLSTVVNFRNRNTVDFAIIDNKNNDILVVFKRMEGFDSIPNNELFSDKLCLEWQNIGAVHPSIGYLIQLTHLTIFNIGITELPMEIGKLVNLEHLNISHNRLTDLPLSLKKLKKLEHLNMSYNEFPDIPRVVYKLISLSILTMFGGCDYYMVEYYDSINELKRKKPYLRVEY